MRGGAQAVWGLLVLIQNLPGSAHLSWLGWSRGCGRRRPQVEGHRCLWLDGGL